MFRDGWRAFRFLVRVKGQTFHSYPVNCIEFGRMACLAGYSWFRARPMVRTVKYCRPARFGAQEAAVEEWAQAEYLGGTVF